MTKPDTLSEDETQTLRRYRTRRRWLMAAVAATLPLGMVLGMISHRLGHGQPHSGIAGRDLVTLVLVLGLFGLLPAQVGQRSARNATELNLFDRAEARWVWVAPLMGVNGLIPAGLFIIDPTFSAGIVVIPLVFVLILWGRARRLHDDDVGQAIAGRAMGVGFIAACASLSALILVIACAPDWFVRLTPMALAAPVAVAAFAFALFTHRAYREA